MKKLIFLIVLLFCFCVFANGGPVFDNKLGATGNLTFVKKTNLQLLKEDLKIKIDGEKAHFQVRYTFQNTGGDTKIQFAFPMETNISDFEISDKEVKRFIEKEKVLSYKISKNGNDLKWLKKSETRKIENCLSADIGDIIKVSEWFISEIEFKKFEKAEIYITYTIESDRELGFYSCSAIPILYDRTVHYNFYPASFFGNGTVGDLSVTVDLTELKKDNGKLEETNGLNFTEQTPGILKFEGKNVDFKKTKDFFVWYSIDEKDKSDYLKAKRLLPAQFRIVSPKISPEDVKKMFDFDPDTCFTPGKENEFTFLFDKKSLPGYSSLLLKTSKNDKFQVAAEMKCDCDLKVNEYGSPLFVKASFEYIPGKVRKWNNCASTAKILEKSNCKFPTECAYDLIDPGEYDATKVEECRIKIKIEPDKTTKKAPCISEIFIMPYDLWEYE